MAPRGMGFRLLQIAFMRVWLDVTKDILINIKLTIDNATGEDTLYEYIYDSVRSRRQLSVVALT